MELDAVLARSLAPRAASPIEDAAGWLRGHQLATADLGDTVVRALAAGAAADRAGWAFASGYREALHRLVGDEGRTLALAATEVGGAHPRAIATRLVSDRDGYRLDGVKRFVTMADACDAAIVIASEGEVAGRNRLAAVLVPLGRAGVSRQLLPPTPFAPEIGHAAVTFERVAIAVHERLPGDGYADYLKPFRTVEDIHVLAALAGWLAATWARTGPASHPHLEALAVLAAALVGIGQLEVGAAATHRALAGAFASLEELLARADHLWAAVDEETRRRWQRDRPILQVAGTARAERLRRARGGIPG
jgi:acyl-CoA dehydrogenase